MAVQHLQILVKSHLALQYFQIKSYLAVHCWDLRFDTSDWDLRLRFAMKFVVYPMRVWKLVLESFILSNDYVRPDVEP
jgi:hypothetical protein